MKSSDSGPLTATQVTRWLIEQTDVYKTDNGLGFYGVINKASTELIGYCGLTLYPDIDGMTEIEIAYRLMREFWGRGYGTEAAIAVRDNAFTTLKIDRLVALIEPSDLRSIRVAKKLDMAYERSVMLQHYSHPDHLYVVYR